MKKTLMIIILTLFVLFVLVVLFMIDHKSNFLGRVKNKSTVFISNNTNLSSASGSYSYSSGSGAPKNDTSSGSGTISSGSVVLTKTYTGTKTNMYRIQLSSLDQLNSFFSKSSFYSSVNSTEFYNYVRLQVSRGSRVDVYLDKTRTLNASVGVYDNYFINSKFIVKSSTCSFAASFLPKNIVASQNQTENKSKTPRLDDLYGGICSPLTAAHSLNSILKLPPPNGMATSTIVNGKRVWNKEYLEWLMQNIPDYFGGVPPENYPDFYKKYLSEIKVTKLNKPLNFKTLTNVFNWYKADCSLRTSGHISHISNVYEKDGKKHIEILDTLEQGDKNHDNITTTPEKITLVVENDGTLTIKNHGNLSKPAIDYWTNSILKGWFQIVCIDETITEPDAPFPFP